MTFPAPGIVTYSKVQQNRQDAISSLVTRGCSQESAARFIAFAQTGPVFPEHGPIRAITFHSLTASYILTPRTVPAVPAHDRTHGMEGYDRESPSSLLHSRD